MVGWTRREEARRRAERARRAAYYKSWRQDIQHEWGIVVHAPDEHHAFCMSVLDQLVIVKPSDVDYFLRREARHKLIQGGSRTLRCRIFGCRPMKPCQWVPHCQNCEGRCARCGNYVVPPATMRARS
jgi:hypothetical protein